MWLVKCEPAANSYLDDSGPYIIPLQQAIIRSMMTDDGIPTEGRLRHVGDNISLWEVADHTLMLKFLEKEIWIEAIYQGSIDNLMDSIG